MVPDGALTARFADDLDRLIDPGERVGVAVSGGPDSLALLLLSAAVRPGLVEAATVDHGLRPESPVEATFVADICAGLDVPHRTLAVAWGAKPVSAVQELARARRYELLAGWLRERGMTVLCTGHHRDDQAETLLMRLSRGAGVRGLAAMRPSAPLPGDADLQVIRPLLSWSRAELAALCQQAGLSAVDDASNRDDTFERIRVRRWIGEAGLDAEALARSAAHLGEAEDVIRWATEREWAEAVEHDGEALVYLPGTAPAQIRRRIVERAIAMAATEGEAELRGGELDRLVAALESGRSATLRGVLATGGSTWRFERAPPRSSSCG